MRADRVISAHLALYKHQLFRASRTRPPPVRPSPAKRGRCRQISHATSSSTQDQLGAPTCEPGEHGPVAATQTPRSAAGAPPALSCPACKLLVKPRILSLSPRYCPRCLAHRRLAIPLEARAIHQPADSIHPGPRSTRSRNVAVDTPPRTFSGPPQLLLIASVTTAGGLRISARATSADIRAAASELKESRRRARS